MKKSPVPLGLNGIYLGKEQNAINGIPESKSKPKSSNQSPSTFLPVSSSPPPTRPPLSPPPPIEGKSPPPRPPTKNYLVPTTLKIEKNEGPSPPPPATVEKLSTAPPPTQMSLSHPPSERENAQKPGTSHHKVVPKSSPSPPRSQKPGNSKENRKHSPPPKVVKTPKMEKEGAFVGKTLRSQKMEKRIRAAAVENDESDNGSTTSSDSNPSQVDSSSNQQSSRSKIYEPDLNTYGISNGNLANRTKRILEKQAKIEGIVKKGSHEEIQDDKKEEQPKEEKKNSSTATPGSPVESKAEVQSPPLSDSNSSPNLYPPYPPYPYPHYGYPPFASPSPSPPPFGYHPYQGYPPYPGYFPPFPNTGFPGNPDVSNFDIHTLMLAKQVMGLSDQLKGLNNSSGFDQNEYLRYMTLFQQLSSGLMEQTNSIQHHQFANEALENERRIQQEEMTRMLQDQIRSLQLQLQQHLSKMELDKRELDEKERRMKELRLKELEELERLRVETEKIERLKKEQAEQIEKEEKRRREALEIEERQERDRIRALREQLEQEEKDRLREIREKAESEEREERERLRLMREKEEKEERDRLKEIRERVEREEKEEKERLREIRERIEREEREEMERLRDIREREEKEALERKLQREAEERLRLEEIQKNSQINQPDSRQKLRHVVEDDFEMTPEMKEMAEEHRRRTGKELPRVLYRLVPHRTKFRRANELFESNIHADQINKDDESLHSVTSETIRNYLLNQESSRSLLRAESSYVPDTPQHAPLQHQASLPSPSLSSTSSEPIVVKRPSKFTCDNPLFKTKDDFWIDPMSTIVESPQVSPKSSPKGPLKDAYDTFKSYLRKKSIFSDPTTSPRASGDSCECYSSSFPQPLPPMNIDKLPIQKRPKRGSKDDLEIERITSIRMSISAPHLRPVKLSPGPSYRHPKKSE